MAPSNSSSASSSDFSNYASSSAPLPSPSSGQPAQYFPSQPNLHRHRTSISLPQSQAPTSQTQPQSQQQLPKSQQQATQQYGNDSYGGANQKGFCLIAEAAKRAQMEVTMRDMGDLSLWFAYVSETEECLLEDVLIVPSHSLAKQVHEHYLPKLLSHDPNQMTTEHEITARNRLFNVDGFGLAWYSSSATDFNDGGNSAEHPALYKASRPPLHDTNFRSICANTASKAVFAHIRAATATAVVAVNNHPFVFGRHTFMHNGVISDFISISRDMVDLLDNDSYANISGSTDSEHFAALYITYLTRGKGKASWEMQYTVEQMRDAMRDAVGTVVKLQRKHIGNEAEPNSLNLCATDGSQIVAFRFRNHAIEQPPSLYYSTQAGVTLNRKYPDNSDGKENPKAHKRPEEHGSHVIVASEPTTYNSKDWNLIEKNHCLIVETSGRAHVAEIEYPREWNAARE